MAVAVVAGNYFLKRSSKALRASLGRRRCGRGWSVRRVVHRRSILFHRHSKFEERAIVLRILVRDSFRNRLRAFELLARIEMHALFAAMHRRMASRAFARSDRSPAPAPRRNSSTAPASPFRPCAACAAPAYPAAWDAAAAAAGRSGRSARVSLLIAESRVAIAPLPILPLHEILPGDDSSYP